MEYLEGTFYPEMVGAQHPPSAGLWRLDVGLGCSKYDKVCGIMWVCIKTGRKDPSSIPVSERT